MTLPKLADPQIGWIIQQAAEYIEHQRQTYRGRAVPLDGHQKSAMRPFFLAAALDSTRVVVLAGERVSNLPFYGELKRMGFEPADGRKRLAY
jgi:hypothetical protein